MAVVRERSAEFRYPPTAAPDQASPEASEGEVVSLTIGFEAPYETFPAASVILTHTFHVPSPVKLLSLAAGMEDEYPDCAEHVEPEPATR